MLSADFVGLGAFHVSHCYNVSSSRPKPPIKWRSVAHDLICGRLRQCPKLDKGRTQPASKPRAILAEVSSFMYQDINEYPHLRGQHLGLEVDQPGAACSSIRRRGRQRPVPYGILTRVPPHWMMTITANPPRTSAPMAPVAASSIMKPQPQPQPQPLSARPAPI